MASWPRYFYANSRRIMTTKLSIACGALRLLNETQLTQNELTNNTREPARLFNAIWADGGVRACLEAGQWRFAKRSVRLDASPSIEPDADFEGGFPYAFEKPDDFVRLMGMWSDGGMREPLEDYREESGLWVASIETIFVAYVSDDAEFGGDLSLWPENFKKFVHAHFAGEMAGPMTSQGKEMLQLRSMLLRTAVSVDAMADPTKYAPVGSWVSSRRGGRFGHEQGR
jgi:hypothetical protein